MCEQSAIDGDKGSQQKFPWRKVPESADKFPFRDTKYYINPVDDEVKAERRAPRMGYVAQRSIDHLESTGRKPDLKNVPWFRAAGSNGRR